MKQISRYLLTLVALLAMTTGAWADGFDVKQISVPESWNGDETTVTTADLPGFKAVSLNEAEAWTGAPASGIAYLFYAFDGNEVAFCSFKDGQYLSGGSYAYPHKEIYSDESQAAFFYTTAPAEPDVKVTINDAKTEASFQMPAFDATIDYELVRDMSVQMTAQVGDGTQEQPRYRVKKDGNNKFIPADMEMAAVPALFTVNDAIEQKALTQTQDYIVQIYAIDAEGQPTGDPMTLATFTFEPGIYAVKAVAADGSDYDGETALSNTFKLFQGYEVEVAAKEFITYYKDEPLYADTETSADAELYTITSVSADQAQLSAAIQTAPSLTPLLIFNNSDQAKTFLLIPANEEPNLALTVAPEFQGTLTGTTIAASSDAQNNYALNGLQFVWVKNAIEIGANKAWLSVTSQQSNVKAIKLVLDDTTEVKEVTGVKEVNDDSFYDLNGRKLQSIPTRKGIYIWNGKKVMVK